ncbi:hypothetical protein HDU83_003706 [Entophlyctis luteolus]|nr:hypothetical protein HDU83_003706 [Entophlyctis luteolus]
MAQAAQAVWTEISQPQTQIESPQNLIMLSPSAFIRRSPKAVLALSPLGRMIAPSVGVSALLGRPPNPISMLPAANLTRTHTSLSYRSPTSLGFRTANIVRSDDFARSSGAVRVHAARLTTAAISADAPTTTYLPPPPKPKTSNRFFSTIGKVFVAFLILPGLISVLFPSLLSFLLPATTLLFVGFVALFSSAVFLGVVLPLLLITAAAVAVPAIIVLNELNKMRAAKKFDSVAWEIVKPSRNFHFDAGRDKKLRRLTVETDGGLVSYYGAPGAFGKPAVDFFVDIGALVETEIMRRDLLGHADVAGYYNNIVSLRGKNVGVLGALMEKVEIPIDRNWVRAKLAARAAASGTL